MGRLEKIVVLTVLFVVAVILAVSLNQGAKKTGPAQPQALASGQPAAQVNGQPTGVELPGVTPGNPQGKLLNTSVQATPVHASPALNQPAAAPTEGALRNQPNAAPQAGFLQASGAPASGLPANSLLRTRDGLEDSLFSDLYIYTWKAGDTFPALSERYYGSQKLTARLRTANEGRNESNLKVGDKIFVPTLEAATPQAPTVATDAPSTAPRAATVADDGVYVVQKGDILGTISQKVYGSAKKWQRIYDANRDVLKDPGALQPGMKLRIPR